MLLALDVGNSHIFGGIFIDNQLSLRFRLASYPLGTSDQIGLFLRQVLRENQIDPAKITKIAISSVVPSLDYSIHSACIKYFKLEPFMVKPGIKTGIRLNIQNPLELGADRLTSAVAANYLYPQQNIIILDLGTATTCCAISRHREYLGGIIFPGIKTAMEALAQAAAKLSMVEIRKPSSPLGKTTEQHLQSGLYYGHLGAMRQFISDLQAQAFANQDCFVIGTGGFASLFEEDKIFDIIHPNLVLIGLNHLHEKNMEKTCPASLSE
jgi:type III pantothenate kinase